MRLIWIAAFLMSIGPAFADNFGKPPPECELPISDIMKRDQERRVVFDPAKLAKSWADEARRIGDSRNVWRYLDRLVFEVDGGRSAVLTDCPFGDGLRLYRYERFDEAGGFYLARAVYHEDSAYTLVFRGTGLTLDLVSLPIWSPDKRWFVYGRCDMMNGPNEAMIMTPLVDGLRVEATISLPCERRDCEFSWESATTLLVFCRSTGQPPVAGKNIKVVLKNGVWRVVP